MKVLKWSGVVLLVIVFGVYAVNNQLVAEQVNEYESTTGKTLSGRFENARPVSMGGLKDTLRIIKRYFTEKKVDALPDKSLPVEPLTRDQLQALSDSELHVIKLGHSSVLMKVMGEFWLLDPVFGKRASPFSFLGPKRFHETPLTIEELPEIERVLISHNHYDHLDKSSVKQLANKTRQFLVPLGVEADLMKWGVKAEKIQRFDWWQELETETANVAFTPTRHFSGRGLTDGNRSLWGSWVIETAAGNVFFSGDSGYFEGFAEIGEKYGPFDITFVETGAYDRDWSEIHMTPEESVQAHIDLKGRVMVPIHNGTFDLAFHAWYEPLERVLDAADRHGVSLSTPVVGQTLTVRNNLSTPRWWKDLIPSLGL